MNRASFPVSVLLVIFLLDLTEAQLRIVGGSDANIEDWPFMVFLVFSTKSQVGPACGASLISSQTILTAAHCLDDVTNDKKGFKDYLVMAYMGDATIFKRPLKRRVVDYTTHPEYSRGAIGHDIGVAFLEKPVAFSARVKKVILRSTPLDGEDRTLMAAGWGAWKDPVDEKQPTSPRLKFIEQERLPDAECFASFPSLKYGNLCAGTRGANTYVFTGDSGGPLVTQNYQQVGLVSYKFREDNGRIVYTHIPDYIEWLALASEQLFRYNCNGQPHNATVDSTLRYL